MQQSMSSGMCDSAPPPSSDSHTIISAGGSELLHLKSNSSTKAMLEQLDQVCGLFYVFVHVFLLLLIFALVNYELPITSCIQTSTSSL